LRFEAVISWFTSLPGGLELNRAQIFWLANIPGGFEKEGLLVYLFSRRLEASDLPLLQDM